MVNTSPRVLRFRMWVHIVRDRYSHERRKEERKTIAWAQTQEPMLASLMRQVADMDDALGCYAEKALKDEPTRIVGDVAMVAQWAIPQECRIPESGDINEFKHALFGFAMAEEYMLKQHAAMLDTSTARLAKLLFNKSVANTQLLHYLHKSLKLSF